MSFYYILNCLATLTFFINKQDYSRDLIISKRSSISSFEIFNVVIPDRKMFFWTATSVADAAVNPNGIKALLANVLSIFSLKSNQFLVMALKAYRKTFLIALLRQIEFLIIQYWLMNHFQKIYQASKLVY